MPSHRKSKNEYTANTTQPTTVPSGRGCSRQSTSGYTSIGRSAPSLPPLTQANLRIQARLLEKERREAYARYEQQQSQRTMEASQQQSQQSTHRPSQQRSTSELFAPLTSILPPKPTPEYLLNEGFTYAGSTEGHDIYEKYTEATTGSKVLRVKDTVAIPSLKR